MSILTKVAKREAINMKLEQKLDEINKNKIKPLYNGTASTIDQLYNDIIKNYMPTKDTVIKWHELLMKIVDDKDCLYAIRAFHSEGKTNYNQLRRGFLTKINNKFNYIYVDNYFIAIIKKMQLDNYVPSYQELIDMIKNRSFPVAYFHTSEEKKLAAYHAGKNPGIDTAYFKIAHIVPTGEKYNVNNKTCGLAEICKKYFPRGNRKDWKLDNNGSFYIRNLTIGDDDLVKKLLTASLLRCIHPLNTFLIPGFHHEKDNLTNKKGIGEYQDLINYMHNKYSIEYGCLYDEFIQKAMVSKNCFTNKIDQNLVVQYGPNINYSTVCPLTGDEINQLLDDYLNDGLSLTKLDEKYFHIVDSHGNKSYNLLRINGISNDFKKSIKKGTFDKLFKEANGSELTILNNYNDYKNKKN